MAFDYKNATRAELKAEYKRIAQEMGDDQFFTKRELAYLPSALADGEQVLAFSSGLMDSKTWLIVLTDRRILFLDKGMLFGLKQTAIELDKVTAVSGRTGLIFGEIEVQEGTNTTVIKWVVKKTVARFANKARDAIHDLKYKVEPLPETEVLVGDDAISKLDRLGDLLAKGVITQEEFSQQKEKLLEVI